MHQHLISYHSLRQFIGWLGLLLPFSCMAIVWFMQRTDLTNHPRVAHLDTVQLVQEGDTCRLVTKPFPEKAAVIKQSVSHYYYTSAGPHFTGIITAIFLLCYRGHKPKPGDKYGRITDRGLALVSAFLAIGIVMFPTSAETPIPDNLYIFRAAELTGCIHLACASLFFIAMALFCLINFRRDANGGFAKNASNTFFLFAGWGMLASLVAAGLFIAFRTDGNPGTGVFWAEVIMLVLFGSAWLVKGKSILTEMIISKFSASS
jgi:hypothetical protein